MLRQTHRPTRNNPSRSDKHLGRIDDLGTPEPAFAKNFVPLGRVEGCDQLVVAGRIFVDKCLVKDRLRLCPFASEHDLHHALEHRHVAADADRQMKIGQRRRHVAEDRKRKRERVWIMLRVWIDEIRQPRLGQRVDGKHFCPGPLCVLERRHHSRGIRARILANDDDEICFFEIGEPDRRFADADRLAEGNAGRFVAHV